MDILFKKITSTSITQYPSILNDLLPYVETSLSSTEILSLGTKALSIGNNLEQNRFPGYEDAYDSGLEEISYIGFDIETVKEKVRNYIFDDIR